MAKKALRKVNEEKIVLASASAMISGLKAASGPAAVSFAAKSASRRSGRSEGKTVRPGPSASDRRRVEKALKDLRSREIDPDILVSIDDPLASVLQTELARISLKKGLVLPVAQAGKRAPVRALAADVERFTTGDWLGWATVAVEKLKHLRKKPFRRPPRSPEPLPNRGRIAFLGDWGTGLYGAPACAESIRSDAKKNGKFDVALHLGDVYYSGTREEVWSRFLPVWPDDAARVNRALNSNHEMYSGGDGYFGETLPAFGQTSSCVAMQNDYFLFVGLDTGYVEHDVSQAQADWLSALVLRGTSEGRRVILFSHHQPYSLYEDGGTKLVRKLSTLLRRKQIHAWYWGHEHRCVLFDLHPTWGLLGRCVGHGGFPYERDRFDGIEGRAAGGGFKWYEVVGRKSVPNGRVLDGRNDWLPKRRDEFGPNGYATLAYDGPELLERVHAPDGRVLHTMQIAQ